MTRRHQWHTRIYTRGGIGETAVYGRGTRQLLERAAVADQLAKWAWSLPGASRPAAQPDARQRADSPAQYRAAG